MNHLHELVLKALASSAVADNGAEAATTERKVVTTELFNVAKECRKAEKPEDTFNGEVSWLYQYLATAEGAEWAQAHSVMLVASKRKDFPYKLPQSFLNAVSVLRGALKRGILKESYAATKVAKQKATQEETDVKRMKRVRDETLSVDQRHLAAEGLAARRRDVAIKAIREAFDKANVKGKEAIANKLEELAHSLAPAKVNMPEGEQQAPHAARTSKKKSQAA